jgi:hypothetical protein
MSHRFRILRDAGLVQTRDIGTTHMNSLRSEELNLLFHGLLQSIFGSGLRAQG